MISLVAKMTVKEDKREEAVAAIRELVAETAKEEGTLFYTVNRDLKNPDTFVFMERYRDKAALDAHAASPHFKAFSAKCPGFMAGKAELTRLEEILSAK